MYGQMPPTSMHAPRNTSMCTQILPNYGNAILTSMYVPQEMSVYIPVPHISKVSTLPVHDTPPIDNGLHSRKVQPDTKNEKKSKLE